MLFILLNFCLTVLYKYFFICGWFSPSLLVWLWCLASDLDVKTSSSGRIVVAQCSQFIHLSDVYGIGLPQIQIGTMFFLKENNYFGSCIEIKSEGIVFVIPQLNYAILTCNTDQICVRFYTLPLTLQLSPISFKRFNYYFIQFWLKLATEASSNLLTKILTSVLCKNMKWIYFYLSQQDFNLYCAATVYPNLTSKRRSNTTTLTDTR